MRREVMLRPPSVLRGRGLSKQNLKVVTDANRSSSTRKNTSSESDPRTHVHTDTSIEGISTPSDISHSVSSVEDERPTVEPQMTKALVLHDDEQLVDPMPPPPDNTAETVSQRSPSTEVHHPHGEEENDHDEEGGNEVFAYRLGMPICYTF